MLKSVGDFLAERFNLAAVDQFGDNIRQLQHFLFQRFEDGRGQFEFDRIPCAFQLSKRAADVVAHFLGLIDRKPGGVFELAVQLIDCLYSLSDQCAEGGTSRFTERANGCLPLRSGRCQLANCLAEIIGADTDGGKLAAEGAGRVLELAHHRRHRRTGATAVKACIGQFANVGGGFFEGKTEGVCVRRGVAHRQAHALNIGIGGGRRLGKYVGNPRRIAHRQPHAGCGLRDVTGGVSEFEAVALRQRQHRRQRFDGFAALQTGAGEIFQRLRRFRGVVFGLRAHLLGGGTQCFHFLGRRARDGFNRRQLRLKICRATDGLAKEILDFARDKGDAKRCTKGDNRTFQAVKRADVALGAVSEAVSVFACLIGGFREIAQTARAFFRVKAVPLGAQPRGFIGELVGVVPGGAQGFDDRVDTVKPADTRGNEEFGVEACIGWHSRTLIGATILRTLYMGRD